MKTELSFLTKCLDFQEAAELSLSLNLMAAQPLPNFTQAGLHLQQACGEVRQQLQLINSVPTVQLQNIANQLAHLTTTAAHLTTTVDRLTITVDHLTTTVAHLTTKVDHLTTKVDHLTTKVDHQ